MLLPHPVFYKFCQTGAIIVKICANVSNPVGAKNTPSNWYDQQFEQVQQFHDSMILWFLTKSAILANLSNLAISANSSQEEQDNYNNFSKFSNLSIFGILLEFKQFFARS